MMLIRHWRPSLDGIHGLVVLLLLLLLLGSWRTPAEDPRVTHSLLPL